MEDSEVIVVFFYVIIQVWRNCQVLCEQKSDSSAFLSARCVLKYIPNYEKHFFYFSIRINCNRFSEDSLYLLVLFPAITFTCFHLKYVLNYEQHFFHLSIRITCNRFSEDLLYLLVLNIPCNYFYLFPHSFLAFTSTSLCYEFSSAQFSTCYFVAISLLTRIICLGLILLLHSSSCYLRFAHIFPDMPPSVPNVSGFLRAC
jgi:hypothetical protein